MMTAPAPMVQPLPIERPGRTRAPAPTSVSLPTRTLPQSTAPGAMWVLGPMEHSCSTTALVLMMVWSARVAQVWTTAKGPMKTPRPTTAEGLITQVQCLTVVR